MLKYEVSELEQRGFAILLPFYVLKMRGQVKKAKTSDGRKALSDPLKNLVSDLMSAVDRCNTKGKINKTDVPSLMEGLERLYKELFSQYKELAEGDIMLNEKLDLYGDKYREENSIKIAKKMLERGMTIKDIAELTELPAKTIKALKPKTKVA